MIRHHGKIHASICNSFVFKEIQHEFTSFDDYIWHFTEGKIIREPYYRGTTSQLSETIAWDLKQRKMSFAGPVVIQSYLQAVGIIDAHGEECMFYTEDGQN